MADAGVGLVRGWADDGGEADERGGADSGIDAKFIRVVAKHYL